MAFSRPVIGINVDLVAASKTGGAFVRPGGPHTLR